MRRYRRRHLGNRKHDAGDVARVGQDDQRGGSFAHPGNHLFRGRHPGRICALDRRDLDPAGLLEPAQGPHDGVVLEGGQDNPVAALIAEVEGDSNITIKTGTEVARIAGGPGAFRVTMKATGTETEWDAPAKLTGEEREQILAIIREGIETRPQLDAS